jgi:hypothetical protein
VCPWYRPRLDEAAGVHDERIIATEFEHWLRDRKTRQ